MTGKLLGYKRSKICCYRNIIHFCHWPCHCCHGFISFNGIPCHVIFLIKFLTGLKVLQFHNVFHDERRSIHLTLYRNRDKQRPSQMIFSSFWKRDGSEEEGQRKCVCVGKKVWEILRGGYRCWRPALQMFGYPAIFLPFPFPCSASTGSHDSTPPFPYTHMHPHTSTVSRRLGEHSSVAPLGSL